MKFLIIILSFIYSSITMAYYDPRATTLDNLFSLQANNFTRIQAPNSNTPSDIAYAETAAFGGTWCMVHDNGSNSTSGSTNGDTLGTSWIAGTTPASRLFGVTYNATLNKFVAVGINGSTGLLITSTNPQSCTIWTSQTIPTTNNQYFRSVATNGSITVAVGEAVTGNACAAIYSTNLTTWTQGAISGSPCAGGLAGLMDVVWSGTKFVAVGTGKYATSTDGINWTAAAMPTSTSYSSIAWNGKVFAAVDGSGKHSAVSSNGTSWTNYATTGDGTTIAWVGNYFLASSLNVTGYNAMYSVDGITWKNLRMFQWPSAIGYDGFQIIAAGASIPNDMTIMRSLRLKL